MFTNWKQRLTQGWNFMRFFRLALALLVIFEAWKSSELLFAAMGGILLFQSLLGVGCCGPSGCDINQSPAQRRSSSTVKEQTTFEEIN